jgi:hypothetical protein
MTKKTRKAKMTKHAYALAQKSRWPKRQKTSFHKSQTETRLVNNSNTATTMKDSNNNSNPSASNGFPLANRANAASLQVNFLASMGRDGQIRKKGAPLLLTRTQLISLLEEAISLVDEEDHDDCNDSGLSFNNSRSRNCSDNDQE